MLLRPSFFFCLASTAFPSDFGDGSVGRSDKKNKSLPLFTLEMDNPSSKSVKIDGKTDGPSQADCPSNKDRSIF